METQGPVYLGCFDRQRIRDVSYILDGRPTAVNVKCRGLEGGDGLMFVRCSVASDDMKDGIVVGVGSIVFGCVVPGVDGGGVVLKSKK